MFSKKEIANLSRLHDIARKMLKETNLAIISLSELMTYGKFVWEITYKHTDIDHEAMRLFLEYADEVGQIDELRGNLLSSFIMIPDEMLSTFFVARWADQVFPRIVIESKYAALLMTTEVRKEVLEFVIAPWKAFLIEFQEPIVEIFCEKSKKDVKIVRVMVQIMVTEDKKTVWCFLAIGESGAMLWRHGISTEQIVDENIDDTSMWSEASFVSPVQDKDKRALLLLGRLIVSTCLAMSNPENFHEQKKTKGRGKKWKRSNIPETRNFILGKPITIDCRSVVKEFMTGKRKGGVPQVRFFVRSHWKKVAYGPQSSFRKLEHIQGYWKGPEEADIMAKTTKLGKK